MDSSNIVRITDLESGHGIQNTFTNPKSVLECMNILAPLLQSNQWIDQKTSRSIFESSDSLKVDMWSVNWWEIDL